MPIEELTMDGIKCTTDLEQLVNSLREKRRYFEAIGCTELHLFIQGPVQAGTIIGSLYRNWIPVKLYHRPTPQQSARLQILDATIVVSPQAERGRWKSGIPPTAQTV